MKKDNYNIKLNNPEPSSEAIQKHKDFDALLDSFQKVKKEPEAGWKNKIRKIGITVVLLGAAAFLLLYFAPQFLPEFGSGKVKTAVRPYVDPPLKNVQAKFASFEFDAYEGGTFEYKSGSKIVIPPGAFVDFSGNLIAGAVTMQYREFHDPVEFFLSGIPMAYDSAGVTFNLESAGMMEIYAEQDGKKLNVKPGSAINVQLVSAVRSKGGIPDYNIYYLDVENKNWTYQGPDRMEIVDGEVNDSSLQQISEPELNLKNLEAEIAELLLNEERRKDALEQDIPEPDKPISPRKADEKGFVFDFEIDKKEFPDLAVYENVMWEVIDVPENNFFHAGLYDMQWTDAAISELKGDQFNLTLTKPDQTVVVRVSPVLSGLDYIKAREAFNAKFSDYQQQKAQRDLRVAAERKVIEKEMATQKARLEEQRIALEQELERYRKHGLHGALADRIIQKKVVNYFSVNNMGVWNCDRPLPVFKRNCQFTLVNREGQQYLDNAAFFVDKSLNTVNRFYASSNNTIGYDERSENLLWVVTNEGKIAIFRPEEFKKLERKSKHTLTLDLVDKVINSEQEVREILSL